MTPEPPPDTAGGYGPAIVRNGATPADLARYRLILARFADRADLPNDCVIAEGMALAYALAVCGQSIIPRSPAIWGARLFARLHGEFQTDPRRRLERRMWMTAAEELWGRATEGSAAR